MKTRDIEVDIAKALCISCMILVHATYGWGNYSKINSYTGVFFLVFFFFSAGFYYKKPSDPIEYIAKKIERLEVPYMCVCLIFFAGLYIRGFRNLPVLVNSLFYALPAGFRAPYMIAGTSTIGIGPIWFLNCLLVCSIFYLPLSNLKTKVRTVIVIFLAVLGTISQKYTLLPFNIQDALIGLLFFHAGHILFPYIRKAVAWLKDHTVITICICIVILIIYVAEKHYLPYQWFNLGGNLYHLQSLPSSFTGFALVLLILYLLQRYQSFVNSWDILEPIVWCFLLFIPWILLR